MRGPGERWCVKQGKKTRKEGKESSVNERTCRMAARTAWCHKKKSSVNMRTRRMVARPAQGWKKEWGKSEREEWKAP